MNDTFKNLTDLEKQFSITHPLENELLGNHPYIIDSLLNNEEVGDLPIESSIAGEKRVLFFSLTSEDQQLKDLEKKIIDSFKFNEVDYLVYSGSKKYDIAKVVESHKSELVVFFGEFSSYIETAESFVYEPGLFTEQFKLGEVSFSYACLWTAKELSDDPGLKKSAWSLIQKVSKFLS